MDTVKLALVHDWLTGMRGGEKCLEVLCRHFPDARLMTLLHVPNSTSPTIERMQIRTSFLQHVPGASRHYRYLLPLMPVAIGQLKIPDDVDLVVSFSHAVAKSVRPPPGVPHVCYCFTPMRYAWHRRNDYFVSSTRLMDVPLTAARNFVLDRVRHWDRATADRVTHFVAISQTVAQRIDESYGRTAEIIYPPVETRFFTPSAIPREDFYLCVSALVPYKRIDLAIEAANRLRRPLIVIGDGPERERLSRMAGPTVTLSGWCSDESIRDHYRRARALLFPGNEDFGIVPVEAQACGTPVIAFGEGGATETVLDASGSSLSQNANHLETSSRVPARLGLGIEGQNIGTGLFFPKQSPESLIEAILSLESQPTRFDPQLARVQAERFALERFERELIDYLESIAGRRVSSRFHKIRSADHAEDAEHAEGI